MTIPGVTIKPDSQNPVIHIQLHPDKLAQYAINILDILPRINESFESQPTGNLYLNKQAYLLGIHNSINTLPDFYNLIVDDQSSTDGTSNPIYPKRHCQHSLCTKRPCPAPHPSHFNGHSAESMWIYTTTLANPFEVFKKSQQIMDSLANTLPADLKITLIFNKAEDHA